MAYGVEIWPVKKQHMQKMSVARMRLLRWMCGKTRKIRIRNERIQEHLAVASIGDIKSHYEMVWTCSTQTNDNASEERFFYVG